jgi:bacteriocin-type transport-associated protein
MREVLLKELNNSDVDWLVAVGHRQEIAPDTILLREGQESDRLYILLEGVVSVIAAASHNPLARAFAALEGTETAGKEIARLSGGETIGGIPFVDFRPLAATVKAMERSTVLSISRGQLTAKLQQDIGFAARFYRAIAILFCDRLQDAMARLGRSERSQGQPLRDVLYVLGQLNDSDIDWMMAAGTPKKIPARTVLVREGGPIDALYILLSGTMSVSVAEDIRNPLVRAFAAIEGNDIPEREIAKISKGEIVGETPFIDSRLPCTTVQALEDSLVLSIPRSLLAAKLHQDIGFAARFYQVIATLLSDRLQGTLAKFGYGKRVYTQGQPLDDNVEYDDELDANLLERMALAGTRFDWILQRVAI